MHITDGNGNTVLELTWQLIAEEGDNALQRLEMITKTEGGILPKDVTLEFYSTQATDEAGEEEMAAAYLENLQTPDPAKDDLTTLLAGYSGDSIVDACVMHGIDPSLKNRATYAEAFGIGGLQGNISTEPYPARKNGRRRGDRARLKRSHKKVQPKPGCIFLYSL